MILIEHKAPHLYREDAYREYCWSVDAYGSYQPASFIYMCYEEFSNLCLKYGLKLIYNNFSKHNSFPFKYESDRKYLKYEFSGLILRLETEKDLNIIETSLKRGKNVIALFPEELIKSWYNSSKEKLTKALYLADKLGIGKVLIDNYQQENIWFKEISTKYSGRLFFTKDFFLSDGYFMDKYGKNENNYLQLIKLVQNFSTFKYPMFRAVVRNNPRNWVVHEPINLIIDIVNHGPDIKYAELEIEFLEQFEPVNTTERIITNLKSLKKATFAFQIIPRSDGNFENLLKIKILVNKIYSLVYFQPVNISIFPSYNNAVIYQSKRDDINLSNLLLQSKKINLYDEVKVLPDLMKVDIRACLNKIRIITEKVCKQLINVHNVKCEDWKLASMIQALKTKKILSSKSISYLHTIRILGNLASHASNENLSDVDVRVASYALSCFIDEIIEKKLLIRGKK